MYKLLVFNGADELQYTVVSFSTTEAAKEYAKVYEVDAQLGWYYEIVPVE